MKCKDLPFPFLSLTLFRWDFEKEFLAELEKEKLHAHAFLLRKTVAFRRKEHILEENLRKIQVPVWVYLLRHSLTTTA
ncbi:hypothetical protein M1146_05775 [Patescibacteria group bacterium]|nr:hypothetical protein [Patescibacteria group bacterium]